MNIKGCVQGKRFGQHSADAKRALNLFLTAQNSGMSYDDYLLALESWARGQNFTQNEIDTFMDDVKNTASYWP